MRLRDVLVVAVIGIAITAGALWQELYVPILLWLEFHFPLQGGR